MHGREFKVSQYADNITLLLQEDLKSVVKVLIILKWFKEMSGLDNNNDKTNVDKIGASRGRSIP